MDALENNFKFSVLMSVYRKENFEYFQTALDSVINQTLQPDEIVIVEDGKLTDELYKVIETYKNKYPQLFKIVQLETNQGLGKALQIGVKNCTYDLIARMDSDDIALSERFEKQINFMREHLDIDVLGSSISEFEWNPENIISYRKLPIDHKDIYKFGQFRCPVNHMTIMYKKQAVLDVGNYQPFKNIEDYWLWGRMLKKGYKFANLPECLVNVRAGNAMLKRRANLTYFFNSELPLHTKLYQIGFISFGQYLKNICLKFLLRLVPFKIMKLIYMNFLRKTVLVK